MTRTRDEDACPGALQVHQAADGPLARIRLPGGMLAAAQLAALADAAERFAAGTLELTSRGNVQLRGITDPELLAGAVADAGLLPSASHELVRNIVASPLSGRSGAGGDVRPLVARLDGAICADADLARLPGRFLFALDDGTGDVAGLAADAGAMLVGDRAALLIAGHDTGIRPALSEVVDALTTLARRFTEVRGNAWRIAELADPTVLLDGFAVTAEPVPVAPAAGPPVGWIAQGDGRVALGAAVPLGVLSARQAQFIAAVEAPVVVTPWRSVVIADLEEGVADTALRVLAPLGLVFDDTSAWLEVSACVGSPGCERSRADVRAEAARAVRDGLTDGKVHYAGCERACGRPPAGRLLVATGSGYQAVETPVTTL